ncbi:glycosyltransferase family 39 protein, partial [Patescibacteria group bacterium]|nr:glycosyltransferase family 39 protein [Patescibacteria group bacterium]
LGIYVLAKRVFSKRTALIAALLYIATPLFVFYDRMVLMEPAVYAVGVWSIYILIRFMEEWKLSYMATLGAVIGVGFFIKSSAAIFLISSVVIGIVAFFKFPKKRGYLLSGYFVFMAFFLIVSSPLFFQKEVGIIFSGSNRYILTIQELFRFPFLIWFSNIRALLEIWILFVFPIIFLASIVGVWMFFRKPVEVSQIFLILWFIASVSLVIIIGKQVQSRYLVAYLPIIVIFAAEGLVYLSKKFGNVALVVGVGLPFVAAYLFVIETSRYIEFLSRISNISDLQTYIDGDTSGYGIDDARSFLEEKSRQGAILVGVRLDSGNPESAMFAYYGPNKSRTIQAIYFDKQTVDIPSDLDYIKSPAPLYFISRGGHLAGMDDYLVEVKRFYKPDNKHYIGVYTLKKAEN